MNYCFCGCGKKVKKKWAKGHNRIGVSPTNSKGGAIYNGYAWTWTPTHPRAHQNGYVKRAVLVAEKRIGRFLGPREVVHHINGNKLDDSPKNLKVLSKREHDKISVLVSVKCMHDGCCRGHKARGLCGVHYGRYVRANKEMPLRPSRGNRWSSDRALSK